VLCCYTLEARFCGVASSATTASEASEAEERDGARGGAEDFAVCEDYAATLAVVVGDS
jgi:hypothetical protein